MTSAGTGRGRRSRNSTLGQDAARPVTDEPGPHEVAPDEVITAESAAHEVAPDETTADETTADEVAARGPGRDGGGAGRRTSARSGQKQPEEPAHQARDAAYRLLAVRARSRSELRQALARKGFDEELVEATLRKFADAGLIDDAAFALAWVRERHDQQGLGRHALGVELRRKGVDEHVIDDALSTVDPESEVERARELVRRKLRGMAGVDEVKRRRRLVSMLARKGHSEGLAFRVVREELEQSRPDGDDPDSADPDGADPGPHADPDLESP